MTLLMRLLNFGRRRDGNAVIDARRNLSGVCGRRYPVILDVHRFFIAIFRTVVNHDGWDGTAPDPLVWSVGALPKRRRLVHAVRDRAFLPGPLHLWESEWVNVPAFATSKGTLLIGPTLRASWLNGSPFQALCVGLLVVWILGLVVFLLWSCSLFMSFGLVRDCPLKERFLGIFGTGRPISVSAVPFGPGIDIWRSCRFIGAIMRSLCLRPGGLVRFVPCSIGVNHCRLRHDGREKCGHGLASKPRESASELFLN